jgi:iron complex outermembrane receptor protein
MTAYTLGSKNRFLSDSLQVNVEIFDWEYRNQQLSHVIVDSAGDSILAVSNAGASTIRGAELDLKYRLDASTEAGLDVQYLDSRIKKFSYLQLARAGAGSLCSSAAVPGSGFLLDCAGLTPPESPRWVLNPFVSHSVALRNGATLEAQLSGHFQTQSYTALNFVPSDLQKTYTTENVTLTYAPVDGRWTVSAFGENLSNVAIKQFTTHTNFDTSQLLAPRTYGLRAAIHFK